ncbi:MAG: Ig-like domain-containing protein, partial [Firmicutes bacterium]|nr:Ig-like domain-containing protein [Bacillota bacterium]
MRKKLVLASLLIFLMVFSGCFSFISSGTTIEIKAAKTELELNESISLEALVKEKNKEVAFDGKEITWEVSDSSIAKLSDTKGKKVSLTALKSGSVTVTASYGKAKSNPITIKINEPNEPNEPSEPVETLLFKETFDKVPNGTNIRKEPDMLDNPESISHTSGTLTVIDGVLEMGSQRFTIE